MKDFSYITTDQYNLFAGPYEWMNKMGFRETLWILDVNWIMRSLDVTYTEWMIQEAV